ncbi:MAG: serine/threonine protein kinase [Wenzhouxiangella sp.]|nr:serine/threonine protein kinase [Wenzhouxiangella sp.]
MSASDSDYWASLTELFHGALEQPASQRRAWLEARCVDNPALLDEVLALLACHVGDDARVDRAVAATAGDVEGLSAAPTARLLGPYRVLELLGQGGMGAVYLAERDDQEYRTRVAIKLIRGFPEAAALERLRRERQILADLAHPNIARLLDGGSTEDGQPYLVMEYIAGVPITQWCRQQELAQADRIRLLLAVCDAVHYAHQNLVIHRDIKPGNVLITADGRPMLVDFGIAKLLSAPAASEEQTSRYYTPGYASPEQLAGTPLTTACDIYGLGRLLLALLGFEQAARQPASEPALGRSDWQRRLPRDLVAIIDQATRAEPDRRYPSAAALRADLINYLDGRAVEAVPSSLVYRLGKFVRRNRPVVAAATLALTVSALLAWQWSGEYQRARQAEASAALEARHAGQVLDFLIDIIGSASPERSLGQQLSVQDALERGHRALQDSPVLDPDLHKRMLLALGEVYQQLEAFDQAEALLIEASQAEEPEIRAQALSLLGYVLIRQQRLDAARPPLQAGLAMLDAHPELSADTRLSLNNHWGLWLLDSGSLDAAREAFAEALADSRALGDDEARSARFLHNLGLAEQNIGRLPEAAEHYRESLAIKARTIGTSHPSYVSTQRMLAQVLRGLGDHQGARQAVAEFVQARIRLFGEDHPGMFIDYNELANAYHDLGEFDQAIALYQRALELVENADATPVNQAIYLNNLAAAHRDRGQPELAIPLLRRSLALRREALGNEHPATALAMHNLAGGLMDIGELAEAASLLDQAISLRSRLFGEEHHATHFSRGLSGTLAGLKGELWESERLLRDALAGLRQSLPDNNLWVLAVSRDLARILIKRGQLAEAETLLIQSIGHYRQHLSASHPLAAVLDLDLARIELLSDRPDQAGERLMRVEALLLASMAADSEVLRKLRCLQGGEPDPSCWRLLE